MSIFRRCWSLISTQVANPMFQRCIYTSIVPRTNAIQNFGSPLTLMTLLNPLSTLFGSWNNPFLREFSSVLKKRKTKMNHHKWRKRNKAKRFKTKAHNQ